jgi:putative peptide zinc metalloprotease protein
MSTTLPPPRASAPASAPPRLAAGVELIGRFEGSGFKEPPFIARRADGQVVQMAPMLFALAEEIDGRRSYEQVGEGLSHRIKRGMTGEMAEMLIEEQLRPLGVVAPADGSEPELKKVDPLLALKFRAKVVPERVSRALTTVFRPLFFPPVVVAVVLGFVALNAWLLGVHGISQSLRHVIYQPALVLMLLGGVVVATAFHEIGHATGCRYGGAKPGVMGVGVYIVWPAFYTDITDAYRLDKKGRLRTDLGGMYFNAVFALVVGGVYALTGFEPVLLLIVLQIFAIIQQSLPLLRLDGYYIISDLTGVPDILLRIRSILTSVLPWRRADERVTELKPWVRVVVTAYVCLLVPVVAFVFLLMLINAPRVFATGWDSFWLHWDRLAPQFDHGQTARGLVSIFQMAVLVLPAAGIAYTTGRVTKRFGSAGWQWSDGSTVRRGGFLAGVGATAALATFLLWPNHEYRPIQPGERGTLAGAFKQIAAVPTGRPSLTAQRERQLGGAPTQREAHKQSSSSGKSSSSSIEGKTSEQVTGSNPSSSQGQAQTTPDQQAQPPDTTTPPDQQVQPQDPSATQPEQQAPPPEPQPSGAPEQQVAPAPPPTGSSASPEPTTP